MRIICDSRARLTWMAPWPWEGLRSPSFPRPGRPGPWPPGNHPHRSPRVADLPLTFLRRRGEGWMGQGCEGDWCRWPPGVTYRAQASTASPKHRPQLHPDSMDSDKLAHVGSPTAKILDMPTHNLYACFLHESGPALIRSFVCLSLMMASLTEISLLR